MDSKTLKVKVFGSSAGNEQNYSASAEAANLAQKYSTEYQSVQSSITVEQQEDAESIDKAITQAKQLRDDPSVLAVIGHSYSGTTRAVLPIYEEAGIPVIIPAATSPYVMYKFDEHADWPNLSDLKDKDDRYARFTNAFRLIPSDVPSQVVAIEATTRKLLGISDDQSDVEPFTPKKTKIKIKLSTPKKPKIMLICDATKRNGAGVYTKPICDSLLHEKDPEQSIASYIARYRELDIDTLDVWEMVTEIHAVMRAEPEKRIIFVGYPELARVLLEELRERTDAVAEHMSSYTFVMSEACLTNELLDFGAKIYVTSPFNPLRTMKCVPYLKDALRGKNIVPSVEGYTYDAIVILSKAVAWCKTKGEVDRECVTQYLQENGDKLEGQCEKYLIGGGERKAAPYYVYWSCSTDPGLRLRAEIRGEHEDLYAKWPCKTNTK